MAGSCSERDLSEGEQANTLSPLFHLYWLPTFQKELPNIAPWLKWCSMQTISFLKWVLGVHSTARNRQVYILLSEVQLFTEDLKKAFNLEETEPTRILKGARRQHGKRRSTVVPNTGSTNVEWKEANRENRYVVTKCLVHGFHHKLYEIGVYHKSSPSCRWKNCEHGCSRYHAEDCTKVCHWINYRVNSSLCVFHDVYAWCLCFLWLCL